LSGFIIVSSKAGALSEACVQRLYSAGSAAMCIFADRYCGTIQLFDAPLLYQQDEKN